MNIASIVPIVTHINRYMGTGKHKTNKSDKTIPSVEFVGYKQLVIPFEYLDDPQIRYYTSSFPIFVGEDGLTYVRSRISNDIICRLTETGEFDMEYHKELISKLNR